MNPGSSPDHAARRDRVRDRLEVDDLDAFYVGHPVDVRWLTGFTGSNGQVLVTRDGADCLVTDGRYREQAAGEVGDLAVRVDRDPAGVLHDDLAGSRRVGVQAEHLSWAAVTDLRSSWADVDLVATTGIVAQARQIKDAHEIGLLTEACRITDEAWSWLVTTIRPGVTERAVAVGLERMLVDLGAEAAAFPTILAAGPNSSRPHHQPTGRPVGVGEVVKVDFGARVGGYHADMTRMLALRRAPERLVELHAHVAVAQQLGVAAATAGATTGAVDAACRDHLAEVGLGDLFVHGTGHGVGLEIHELPAVAKGATATLAPGMTITVEPGAYEPGVGGVRIEDTIVVTASGPQRLTRSARDLVVV